MASTKDGLPSDGVEIDGVEEDDLLAPRRAAQFRGKDDAAAARRGRVEDGRDETRVAEAVTVLAGHSAECCQGNVHFGEPANEAKGAVVSEAVK